MKKIMRSSSPWSHLFKTENFPVYPRYIAITVHFLSTMDVNIERPIFEKYVYERAKRYEGMSGIELVHINCEAYSGRNTQTWLIGMKFKGIAENINKLDISTFYNYCRVNIKLLER